MNKMITHIAAVLLALTTELWAANALDTSGLTNNDGNEGANTVAMPGGSPVALDRTTQKPPVIVSQPLDLSVLVNGAATFDCSVAGSSPLKFQWYYSGLPLTNRAGRVAGANSWKLVLSAVQLEQSGNYWVSVSNSAGQATSRQASLTVCNPVKIVVQPQSVTTWPTATVQFHVEATGSAPLQFQWYRNNLALAGKITPDLVISNVQSSDKGAYCVKVRNAASSAISKTAQLQVQKPGQGELQLQKGDGLCVPHVAARSDDTTWLTWYEPTNGNYMLRLQRMDLLGHGLLGTNGVLASSVDSVSWVMDYDLTTDDDGNAILAYSNTQDNILRVQKFNAQGIPCWGASGVIVSSAGATAYSPQCVSGTNGETAIVWLEDHDPSVAATSHVCMTRMNSNGQFVWAAPVDIEIPAESVGSPQIVAGAGANVILVWVENAAFDQPGDAYAEQIDGAGMALWPQKVKINGTGQLAYPMTPTMVADNSGGFYATWTALNESGWFEGHVQHIDSNGNLLWGTDGQLVSTSTNTMQLPSVITFLPSQNRIVVAWQETDQDDNLSGINVQAFDSQASRLWADSGLVIVAATPDVAGYAGALQATTNGVALFFSKGSEFGKMTANVASLPAQPAATPTETTLSSVLSDKEHPSVSELVGHGYWLVWEDSRGGIFGAFWTAP